MWFYVLKMLHSYRRIGFPENCVNCIFLTTKYGFLFHKITVFM